MGRWRGRAAALIAVAATALAAGCGSSTNTPGGGGAKPSAAAQKLTPASLQTFLKYTGGHAGKADVKATPVVLGMVNQQGGASDFHEFTPQVQSAVDMVNNELGGIDGHPIKLVTCFVVDAEEQGQTCGQRFAARDDLKAVMQLALSFGDASFHDVVGRKKIPVVGALPTSTPDALAPDSFYTSAGVFGTVPDYVRYLKDYLHAKTVALVNPTGDPTSASVAQLMKQGLQLAGIKVQQSTFSLSQTDVTGPLAAAGAQSADAIIPLVLTAPQCLGMANTLKRLGINKPVLALYGCVSASLRKQLGDYPKWTYASGYYSEYVPSDDADTTAAVKAYDNWYTRRQAVGDTTSAVIPLQTVLTMTRFLNLAGGADATRASIATAAKSWQGPIFLGPPDVRYGGIPALPALPSLAMRFFDYEGNGSWKDATGRWITGTLGGTS